MRKRCRLCDGKLVDNVCVECGLDNSKGDDSYVSEPSSCHDGPMTHVHEGHADPLLGKTLTYEQQEQLKEEIRRRMKERNVTKKDIVRSAMNTWQDNSKSSYLVNVQSQAKKVKKKTKRTGGVLHGLVLSFTVIGIIAGIISAIIEEIRYSNLDSWGVETIMWEDSADPYDFVTRELSEEGETYSISLGAGLYKVGVHIPEGSYTVRLVEGEGSMDVDDEENAVYLSYSFGVNENEEFEYVTEVADVRLYDGAIVEIVGKVGLDFSTENAQITMESIPNPNTESGTFTDEFTVGEDIPAGVYDIRCIEGSGIFDYDIKHTEDFSSYEGKTMGCGDSAFPEEYKNIVLPEGTTVILDSLTVTLTPSAVIESEDYSSFYAEN